MTYPLDDMDADLQRRLRSYGDFLSATLGLKEALENDATTDVDRLIERRAELIGVIDRLDRKISRNLPISLSVHRAAMEARMAKKTEGLQDTLRRIVSVNQECERVAAGKCDDLRKAMTANRLAKEGLQGYAPKTERPVHFLNMKM